MDIDVLVRIPNKRTKVGIVVANRHVDELYDYYWAKIFGEQEIEEYEELEKTVTVNILDYIKFEQSHKYHNCFEIYEDDSRAVKLTDILEIHFLELPKK